MIKKYLVLLCVLICNFSYSENYIDVKKYADNPDDFGKNSGTIGLEVTPIVNLSAELFKIVELCLESSKKTQPNEFLIDWDSRDAKAKVSVYEGDMNYLLIFYTEGEMGGGLVCFVEKRNRKILKIEPSY